MVSHLSLSSLQRTQSQAHGMSTTPLLRHEILSSTSMDNSSSIRESLEQVSDSSPIHPEPASPIRRRTPIQPSPIRPIIASPLRNEAASAICKASSLPPLRPNTELSFNIVTPCE